MLLFRTKAVVICEIKLFWNNFEIISALYFTYRYNHRQMIACEIKSWNNFIWHVTTFKIISKELWNYFSIISVTLNMLEIFMSCNKPLELFWNNFSGWHNFEMISDVITCEIKHWNNFEIISMFYFTCNHGIMLVVEASVVTYVPWHICTVRWCQWSTLQ